MEHGIDVASHQAGLNVGNCVDGNGVAPKIVIVKATGGTKYTNPECDKHYQQAKKAGKLLGFYHYAMERGGLSNNNPTDEANYFVKESKNYFNEAVPFLDIEESVNGNNAAGTRLWSQADVDWCYTWLKRVEALTGVKPVIYMSKSVCRQLNWSKIANEDFGLWVAQYGDMNWTNFNSKPWTDSQGLGAWKYAMMYQYSSMGRLQGWKSGVDFDLFYGDADAWHKYAKGAAPKPVTPNVPDVKPVSSSYNFAKGKYEALRDLPVMIHSDFTGVSNQTIKKGEIFDIVAVVETKGGTTHGETTAGGFVTMLKDAIKAK